MLKIFHLKKQRKKPEFSYIEIPITLNCNLKCNHCTFFCNLIDEKVYVDINEFKKDINKLAKKIDIKQLRLIGGEPLLHPDINQFVQETKNAFPKTSLSIATNAILINSMPESFWKTLKEYKTGVNISYYDIWENNFYKVTDILKEKEINYTVNNINFFYEQLNINGDSPIKKTFKNCLCKEYINLWEHKLYKCQKIFRLFYNKKYNTSIELPPGIDIYKASGKELYNKLVKNPKPFSACRYCHEKGILHKWSRYKQE